MAKFCLLSALIIPSYSLYKLNQEIYRNGKKESDRDYSKTVIIFPTLTSKQNLIDKIYNDFPYLAQSHVHVTKRWPVHTKGPNQNY